MTVQDVVNYYLNNPPFEIKDETKYQQILNEALQQTLIELSENDPILSEKTFTTSKSNDNKKYVLVDIYNDIDENAEDKIKIWQIFKDKRFLFTVIAMFMYSCTEMGIASWISVLFVRDYNSPKFMATLALSSYWTAQLLGRLTIGMKVDKFESENLISTLFFISALFLLSGLISKNSLVSYIFFTLSGFSMGAIWPTILSDARNRFIDFPGTAFGIIAASGAAAGIIIVPLIGRLADLYSVRAGLFIVVFTSLSGGFIYIVLKSLVKK